MGCAPLCILGDRQLSSTFGPAAIRLTWEDPWMWGGTEELGLQLESRASGQVLVVRLRVDGTDGTPVPIESGASWSFWTALLLVLAGFYAVLGGGSRRSIERRAPLAPSAPVFDPPSGHFRL